MLLYLGLHEAVFEDSLELMENAVKFLAMHWLAVNFRSQFKKLVIIFKALYDVDLFT